MRTHRCSGLLISKFALWKFFRYLINCAGVTRQNRFLRNHDFWVTPLFYSKVCLLSKSVLNIFAKIPTSKVKFSNFWDWHSNYYFNTKCPSSTSSNFSVPVITISSALTSNSSNIFLALTGSIIGIEFRRRFV